MNHAETALLKTNEFFKGMSQEEFDLILTRATTRSVARGALIMEEGQPGEDFFIILDGEVEIFKKDRLTLTEHHISTLHSGDTIGEMALIDNSPRSASVRANTETRLLVLPIDRFVLLRSSSVLSIAQKLTRHLRQTSETAVKSLQDALDGTKMRLEMGSFFFKTLILLSLWIFFDQTLKKIGTSLGEARTVLSIFLIMAIFLLALAHVRKSIFPLSFFGITLKNWRKNCLLAAAWSLLFIIATLVLKRFLAVFVAHDSGIPYIDLHFSLFSVLYILFVPLQEFMARGVFQSSLQVFLDKKSPVPAIFLSNLMFAALHVQISALFALFVFVGGVFWGWMYYRQQSLVGPIVAHGIMGGWLGMETGVRQMFLEFTLPH